MKGDKCIQIINKETTKKKKIVVTTACLEKLNVTKRIEFAVTNRLVNLWYC